MFYCRLYVFIFICLLFGIVFFFGGILCGFSEKIFFWRYWEIFCIIGLIFFILGVVLLFVFIVLIIYCRKEVGWFIVLRKLLKIFFSCWSLFVFFLLLIGLFDKMCYFLEDLDIVCDYFFIFFFLVNVNVIDWKFFLSNL